MATINHQEASVLRRPGLILIEATFCSCRGKTFQCVGRRETQELLLFCLLEHVASLIGAGCIQIAQLRAASVSSTHVRPPSLLLFLCQGLWLIQLLFNGNENVACQSASVWILHKRSFLIYFLLLLFPITPLSLLASPHLLPPPLFWFFSLRGDPLCSAR